MTDTAAPTVKDAVLRAFDLSLIAGARRYDLRQKSERKRSCDELSQLYFYLGNMIDVDLFVECGAKDGSVSRRARRRLDPRRIVAFEANPFTYKRFKKANADPVLGVEYVNQALSDTVGDVTLHVRRGTDGMPRADGQASLLERVDEIEKGFVDVTVEATTVDAFLAGHDFERAALWVDVEGGNRQVLTGAEKTLTKAPIVIVELEDRPMWGAEQWLRGDVVSYLYDHGLVPIGRDFQSRYQYNVVFLREDLLDNDRVRYALTMHASAADVPSGDAAPAPAVARRPANPALTRAIARAGEVRRQVRAMRKRMK